MNEGYWSKRSTRELSMTQRLLSNRDWLRSLLSTLVGFFIDLRQQAATLYERQGDPLNHALVLSFLTTAFEDLGQGTQAKGAIHQVLSLLQAESASNFDRSLVLAQVLTSQGELQFAEGNAAEAAETWRRAEAVYRRADDSSGIVGSQINQATLQAEGLYRCL